MPALLPKLVFDTNLLISAALFVRSTPHRVLQFGIQNAELLYSEETLNELLVVLARSKFDVYLSEEAREAFVSLYVRSATLVTNTPQMDDCRDPKDNKFLNVAVGGRADAIITGDTDLLTLHPYRGISILTPADFLSKSI